MPYEPSVDVEVILGAEQLKIPMCRTYLCAVGSVLFFACSQASTPSTQMEFASGSSGSASGSQAGGTGAGSGATSGTTASGSGASGGGASSGTSSGSSGLNAGGLDAGGTGAWDAAQTDGSALPPVQGDE